METPEKSSKKINVNWTTSAEDFDKLSEQSKSFCPLLYYHSTIDTIGNQKLCCIATPPPDSIKVSHSTNSIQEWWNSDYLKKSRKMLNNNSYPIECIECKEKDAIGIPSFRSQKVDAIRNNEQLRTYIYNQAVKAIKNNFSTPSPAPINFDIKFGNLCNLKCRMCDYMSSSQILKEIISNPELEEFSRAKIDEHDLEDNELRTIAEDKNFNFRYFEKENFVQSFESVLDNTVFLKFTGGEPLLISNLFKVLKKLIDKKLASGIELHIITNATKITKEMIEDYFIHFKKVSLSISLDGYKDNYEYVRYPARWKVIENALELVKKYSDTIILDFSITFQTYTVISMIKQYEFMSKYAIEGDLNENGTHPSYVNTPTYLDIKLLPNAVKDKLIDIYKSNDIINRLPKGFKKDWTNKIKYLSYRNKKEDDLVAIKEFVRYTNSLDKVRNQKFKDSCPQEWELLKEYFNDQ